MKIFRKILSVCVITVLAPMNGSAKETSHETPVSVADNIIEAQRAALAKQTKNAGFGPQSPRDINSNFGTNYLAFSPAPDYREMNLCNIHFHKNAEHKGGEFTQYAGNGDAKGFQSGYRYSGQLSKLEQKPIEEEVCQNEHGGLGSGDTIEVHYVYSTAKITPGPTLAACLSDSTINPQLRVEAQVYVLVNDKNAQHFGKLAEHRKENGRHQAINIPKNTIDSVQYSGSTTGPGYNETGSPFQVSWSVRPRVTKVSIVSLKKWCNGNDFNEDHAHGVRNLVVNPDLLSEID